MAFKIAPLKSCLILLAVSAVLPRGATAQIIPDGTLGPESSQLIDTSAVEQLIRGGARRDENLFHSFEQFSIGDGGKVTFDNPAAVQRVFSRVTGDLPSEIFGTLGSTGTADVYFLNPNGIVFGPNAQLDVGGSFVASTADSFEFSGLGLYSARNPESPSSLLTILPSALQFGQVLPPGSITAQAATLQVPEGESLVLLGGDVTLSGTDLTAVGGRVELGAAAGAGTVEVAVDGRLTFADGLTRGSVALEDNAGNDANIDVRGSDGGDISVTARSIDIVDSLLFAGINRGLGTDDSQAGDIVLNATEYVRARDNGRVLNQHAPNASGSGGNIEITTAILEVLDGSNLSASTFGRGDAGSVVISVEERVTFGTSENGADGGDAFSIVASGGIGDGGNIEIDTSVLEVLNGSELSAGTFGQGDAGDILISASGSVQFSGSNESGTVSKAASRIQEDGVGTGGNIEIETPVLEVLDGAQLQTRTDGTGDGGNIIINASEGVTFARRSASGRFGSAAVSDVGPDGTGNGGSVDITTSVLQVLDGARLLAGTLGNGNAGRIFISAEERVTFGTSENGTDGGDAFSIVASSGIGDGGNIEIDTSVLEVLNGSELSAGTFGQGDAGDILISASGSVQFSGSNESGTVSKAASRIQEDGVGTGGNIEIETPVLEVLDGAQLQTRTDGTGDGGNIIINASEGVTFARRSASGRFGSAAVSDVGPDGTGNGGSVDITTSVLQVLDGARLLAGTLGNGNAGRIFISAEERVTFGTSENGTDGGDAFSIVASSGIGDGGNIEIDTSVLEVLNGSELSAGTFGQGSAGDILISADELIRFAGSNEEWYSQ